MVTHQITEFNPTSCSILPNGSMGMAGTYKTKVMKKDILVLAGSSGAGKTTLAKALAVIYGKTFMEQSAGGILSDEAVEALSKYGYHRNFGQENVIKLSNSNAGFAIGFQVAILEARVKIIQTRDNLVLDRSPLDVIPFILNQAIHHLSEAAFEKVLGQVADAMLLIPGMILLPFAGQKAVEENGARVANKYFQHKVSMLYQLSIDMLAAYYENRTRIQEDDITTMIVIDEWGWDLRLAEAMGFVESLLGWKRQVTELSQIPGPHNK